MLRTAMRMIVAAGCLALAATRPATAQTVPPGPGMDYLLFMLPSGTTFDRYMERVRVDFRTLDADRDGQLSKADLEQHRLFIAAGMRSSALTSFLRADLDGDGVVTLDELRRTARYHRRPTLRPNPSPSEDKEIDQEIAYAMASDLNGDGRITLEEALNAANEQRKSRRGIDVSEAKRVSQALALDSDGDGVVKLAELEAAAEALFRAIDIDRNGTITQQELSAHQSRLEAAAAEQRHAGCSMPVASAAAQVVMLSTDQGRALSTVTVGSQDHVTGVAPVVVEPGDRPIYLVVVSRSPTIWHLRGAVGRIERVVVAGTVADEWPLAGVMGIAAERTHFLRGRDCINYFEHAPPARDDAVAHVRRHAGKDPVVLVGFDIGGFSVPSGEARPVDVQKETVARAIENVIDSLAGIRPADGPPAARANDLARDAAGDYDGGLVDIDPAQVIARPAAERYEVLPRHAGLLQLVKTGAVTRKGVREFVVERKIRFPAELHGIRAKFVLRPGVPSPDGEPHGACVILEETGQPLGRRC